MVLLQVAQPLVELQEFLEVVDVEETFTSAEPTRQLIQRWQTRQMSSVQEELGAYEQTVLYRNLYLSHLLQVGSTSSCVG